MSSWRIVRILGSVLVVLGFGSIVMRSTLNMDTILTAWMGGTQPVSGIIMGVVGIGVFSLAVNRMKQAAPVESRS